jgi:agmatine deiminase
VASLGACVRRLPAEWEPQDGVMLTWPHDGGDWRPFLAQVEPVYVRLAAEICRRGRLLACARDAAHAAHLQRLLDGAGVPLTQVRIAIAPSNDSWSRDHGPLTVLEDGRPRLLDFRFNGWGGKYPADLDDAIPERLCAAGVFGTLPRERVDFVLEGGGIESDGEGTLLTTAQCLLSPGRNPGLDRAAIERRLVECFGLSRVLWLGHGHLEGDDTDSHIDTLARFCDPRTIAFQACDDPHDAHHADLSAMEAELRALRRADGTPYRLVPLPWPAPKRSAEGRRLPASYANFLVVDGAVLVPTYRDAADALALARLAECFPGREIVGIDCLPLIEQNGSLHCITMQLPRGVLAPD